jgi:outer membrane receptor protein involved in Fe transport
MFVLLMRRAGACLFALVVSFISAPASAQVVTGSIEGTVVDASGGVLPGATVTVSSRATGLTRSAVSDSAGLFRVPLLPVGTYDVTAELSGFTTRKQPDVPLTIGQTVTLRLELTVASVTEKVVVSGASPVVETSRSQVSSTVNETAIANLPVNGRNFIDFALLTPGVTRDVRTGDISFAGQRGTLNSLVVDGADNNNTFFGQTLGRAGSGRAPYQFSTDVVQEFQINSNAYSAEYGRAGGAVINVVTKSGTNALRGSAFEYYRDKGLNANDAVNVLNNRPKSPYHFNQFGGNVGGPIQKDKHFFFLNYDGQRNTQPNDVVLGVSAAAVPSDPASQAAYATLGAKADSWTRKLDQDVFLVKTDSQFTPNNRVTLRYNHQNFDGIGFENGGIRQAYEHSGTSSVFTRSFNASVASVVSPTLFNEARLQIARDREPGSAYSDTPEATISQGGTQVLVIGRNFFSPRETTIKRWQVADNLTWVRGEHKVKGGFDFQFDDILNYFPGNFGGSYTFASLASFNSGRPTGSGERYVQAFPGTGTTGPETHPNSQEYSVFVQDEWRPRQDLTVNAGLRYDLQKFDQPPVKNPDAQLAAAGIDTSSLNTDTNNWGPRLGVAWSPAGSKLVVRGGYGLFYGRTPAIMVGTAHSNNGINVQTITFTGSQVPTYPARFDALPTGISLPKPTIFVFDDDFQNARLQQASAGVEYEILPNTSLALSYLFVKGDDLSRSTDINIGTKVPATFALSGGGTVNYYQFTPGPFTDFARIIGFQSSAESRYNGLTVELTRRFAQGLQAKVSYTLGRVEDTAPDATAVVPSSADDAKFASDPSNFETDRTDGGNDQRHRFVTSAVVDLNAWTGGMTGVTGAIAKDWTVSVIFTAQSGQPYSGYVDRDINLDGNTRNDIAPGTTRNQFRLPNQYSFDPRIARNIPIARAKLQLIFEAFNLFNADNISGVNTAYYRASSTAAGATLTPVTTFGQPTSSSGPRIIQLAAKVLF